MENENSDNEMEETSPQPLSHVRQMAKKFEMLQQAQLEPQHIVCPKRDWRYLHLKKQSSSHDDYDGDVPHERSTDPPDNDNNNSKEDEESEEIFEESVEPKEEDEHQRELEESIPDEEENIVEVKNEAVFQDFDKHPISDYEDFSDESEFSTDSEESFDLEKRMAEIATDRTESIISNQVSHIVLELLGNEQSYIDTLTVGIDNYITVFDQETLPDTLYGQKFHIFGNIDRIRNFHRDIFHPCLMECGSDVEQICHNFCRFIQEDYFYPYILYAINRKRSETLCILNKQYFQDRQNERHDKLGINSFLVQPIQRLPKYQLLLRQLIKELSKHLDEDGTKQSIAACCRAEKHVQRLLDRVNDSMSINDIVECYEINILKQGKFKFLNIFDIVDNDLKRRYRGKIFFFEKCVINTEILEKTKLHFRGCYIHTDIGIAFEEGKNKFFLYHTKRNHHEIECSSDFNTIQFWTESLREMMMKSLETRKKIKESRDSGISDSGSVAPPQFVLIRNTISSGLNSNSSSGASSAWTSGISSISNLSNESDSRRTTWYTNNSSTATTFVNKGNTLDRLLNSEKHFIQILTNYLKTYVLSLPYDKAATLASYTQTVRSIIEYHKTQHYPNLKNCQRNIMEICDVFKESLRNATFILSYQLYAAHCTKAYQFLDEIHNEPDSDFKYYTYVPMEHLNRSSIFLNHLLTELKDADDTYVSDEFKAVAVTEIQLTKFRARVWDNLNLNSIKTTYRNIVEEFGLVEFSEPVTIYTVKHRLLLLQRGLALVKTRLSTKTNRDKFTELVFALPLTAVRTSESNINPARIKIFASYAKDVVFKLDFATVTLKKSTMDKVDVFKNMGL